VIDIKTIMIIMLY